MKDQSGNVLIYILIAVALLAALSFTVAHTTRGGTGALSKEQAALNASEIIEYGNILTQGVSQTKLRGYPENTLSFENPAVEGYANKNCAEEECKIFSMNGAGLTYTAPKKEWLDGTKNAEPRFGEMYFTGATEVEGIGTEQDDLVMVVPYLKQELCKALNDKLGIKLASGGIPKENNGPVGVNLKFTGSFETYSDTKISGEGALNARTAGCTESSGGGSTPSPGTYHYYQVLIAR